MSFGDGSLRSTGAKKSSSVCIGSGSHRWSADHDWLRGLFYGSPDLRETQPWAAPTGRSEEGCRDQSDERQGHDRGRHPGNGLTHPSIAMLTHRLPVAADTNHHDEERDE